MQRGSLKSVETLCFNIVVVSDFTGDDFETVPWDSASLALHQSECGCVPLDEAGLLSRVDSTSAAYSCLSLCRFLAFKNKKHWTLMSRLEVDLFVHKVAEADRQPMDVGLWDRRYSKLLA